MAAMTRSQYSKFRASGGRATSQSSFAISLVRRQKAAENDYYDEAYKMGSITADQYISNLTQRIASQPWITPLQRQNLRQRIQDVQQEYQDSLIETAYRTGQTYNGEVVDAGYMLKRAEAKLQSMIPGSEAYNRQQQVVNSFQEKVAVEADQKAKSDRRDYRTQQLLQLSNMTEKTSAEAQAKADMYEKLRAMALADGETQEAQQYEIQRNNAQQTADSASVSERLQAVRVENSTPVDPLQDGAIPSGGGGIPAGGSSVPSAAGGAVDTTGSVPPAEEGGGSGEFALVDTPYGIQLPKAVADSLAKDGSVARYLAGINKYIQMVNGDEGKNNGLNKAIASQQSLVNAYAEELQNATAANRDELQKGYNDQVEKLQNLQSRRDELIMSAEEKQAGLAEFITDKATSLLKNFESSYSRKITNDVMELEKKMAAGKLKPEDYTKEIYNIYADAQEGFGQISSHFESLGDAASSSQAANKYDDFSMRVANIATDWKPKVDAGLLRVVQYEGDTNATVDLAGSGYKRNKGDFVLVDPTAGAEADENSSPEEALQKWESEHTQVGGKWYKVYPNTQAQNLDPTLKEAKNQKAAASETGNFYYNKMVNGQPQPVQIRAVDYEGKTKYIPEAEIPKYLQSGYVKEQGGKVVRNYNQAPNVVVESAKNIGKELINPNTYITAAKNIGSTAVKANNWLRSQNQTIKITPKSVKSFLDQAREAVTGAFNKSNPLNPPKAQAAAVPTDLNYNGFQFPNMESYLAARNASVPASFEQKGSGYNAFSGKKPQVVTATNPNATPQPTAAPKSTGAVGKIIDEVSEIYAPGDDEFRKVMHAIALAESGGNPNAVGDNGESIGVYQNRRGKGRGGNYSVDQLKDPRFNTELAAKELVYYYRKGREQGLSGRALTEYVSKHGQRPAAGNERKAGANYGRIVNVSAPKITNEPHMMKNPTATPTTGTTAKPNAKTQSFLDAAKQAIVRSANAQEPVQNYTPNINYTPAPSNQLRSQQKASVAPVSESKLYTPANKIPASFETKLYTPAPKPTPAPAPAPRPMAPPTPKQPSIIEKAKGAASGAFNWLKGLFR